MTDRTDDRETRGHTSGFGGRLYEWYAEHDLAYAVLDRLSRSLRVQAVEALGVGPGDVVLDLGCGPGRTLDLLRERVGPDGTVLGLDLNPGMVRTARERVRTRGWRNVHVVRGDATALPVAPGRLDGAVASLALTAMADPEAAARAVAAALREGGRLAVLDAAVERDRLGPLYPVVAWLFRRTADWNPAADVGAALEAAFPRVALEARVDGGTAAVWTATA